jgi:ribulose-5-phosphate 4-epimerase/fuculose-1-phosphate aldolase
MTNTVELPDRAVDPIETDRVDLACAFRWAVRLNWHESVANHFSLRVRGSGTQFLLNPRNRHFSLIRASDLQLFDVNDPAAMSRDDAPDATAWGLHGSIHRHCPQALCALHLPPALRDGAGLSRGQHDAAHQSELGAILQPRRHR